MKKVTTNDGSITYFNEKYHEHYHSTSGAMQEALEKFARPCRLKDGMKVLDVCFGLGYNSLAAITLANVEIVALENDPLILKKIQTNNIFNNKEIDAQNCTINSSLSIKNSHYNDEKNINQSNHTIKNDIKKINYPSFNKKIMNNYEKIKRAANDLEYGDGKIKIKIILGDARKTIKLGQQFDAVFLDPFSPKKSPELWTETFFNDIKKVTKENRVLTTYSCSKMVRENLKKAGFSVEDGPSIGRKSPSTIAYSI